MLAVMLSRSSVLHEPEGPSKGLLMTLGRPSPSASMHGTVPACLERCTPLPTVTGGSAEWDVKDGGQDSTAMSRRSGPSSGFILNKPCLHKRVQEINLRAGLAGLTRPVHAASVWKDIVTE